MKFVGRKASSTTRESYIEKKVSDYARKLGWLTFKWTSTSQRFVPDRLFFYGGKVVIVEFKAPGKEPSKAQRIIHNMLDKVGFPVYVIDDVEEGKKLFNGETK